MFENTKSVRRITQKSTLMSAIELEKSGLNRDYKIRQLEGKLATFNQKNYPNVIWDSAKGTYRKERK